MVTMLHNQASKDISVFLNVPIVFEALKRKTGNVHFCEFFSYYPCPLWETMKFRINQRYNRKTWRGLNNQQLKYPTQMKNRESINFDFVFSQWCKNEHSLFFTWGLHVHSHYKTKRSSSRHQTIDFNPHPFFEPGHYLNLWKAKFPSSVQRYTECLQPL